MINRHLTGFIWQCSTSYAVSKWNNIFALEALLFLNDENRSFIAGAG